MGTIKTTNIETITGSGTLTLGQSGETVSIPTNTTLGASGTTITVPSGCTITNNGTQTGFGGVNTPIVYVEATSGTALSTNTTTKITLDNEFIDTDNAFASSRFTVPSGKAGKYFVNFQISINHNTTENSLESLIYKNGSIVSYAVDFSSRSVAHTMTVKSSIVINLSVGDYLEFYGRQNSGTGIGTNGGLYTFAEIFKLIE